MVYPRLNHKKSGKKKQKKRCSAPIVRTRLKLVQNFNCVKWGISSVGGLFLVVELCYQWGVPLYLSYTFTFVLVSYSDLSLTLKTPN